jgi:hypothetical protein
VTLCSSRGAAPSRAPEIPTGRAAVQSRLEIPCTVGRRTISIKAPGANDGDWIVIGQADVVVAANRDVRVRIEVQPLAP